MSCHSSGGREHSIVYSGFSSRETSVADTVLGPWNDTGSVLIIVVKFKTFRIKFKKVQEKNKVRKSSKAALMPISQSSSSSEDQSIQASLSAADFFNDT